ncbi:MAG: hypothetical protein DRQ01_06170 [Ignavibacteriae bacterium]|nr:MAG: hypothetical protein DRQ01_06170 [Ignavibacteriota bacterium]
MRNLFLILVVFSVLFIIGCQENLVTEPTQSLSKKENLTAEGTINLYYMLNDPSGGSCRLTGEVNYNHRIYTDQLGLYEVTLTLNMSSQLCNLGGPIAEPWTIEGWSEDVVIVSEDESVILDKRYEVKNRYDIVLVVHYLVTKEGVEISNLWLQID